VRFLSAHLRPLRSGESIEIRRPPNPVQLDRL
jgi:hypothetical protein